MLPPSPKHQKVKMIELIESPFFNLIVSTILCQLFYTDAELGKQVAEQKQNESSTSRIWWPKGKK